MLESLNYSFRNSKNIIWVIYLIKQLRNYKIKTMWSSEDPSLINNVDELGLVEPEIRATEQGPLLTASGCTATAWYELVYKANTEEFVPYTLQI